ncbi:G-protein coupled receptor Mth2-like isoform X2 [Neodiprion fabricii]|uniref:G-protein coupled receptor Mth2-like isoform X2 n=1 Tax=Neodiprion fabricii TaxID=2872261 RepID=UPI001ED92490|nr:G-protein coupled receptor Mth2-like isoform X2 [Neodiprion fabricii]
MVLTRSAVQDCNLSSSVILRRKVSNASVVVWPRTWNEMELRLSGCISVLLLAALLADAERRTCPPGGTVSLTNARRNDSGFLAESGEFFPRDVVWEDDGTWSGCFCDLKPCLPLCPPKNATTQDTETMEIDYSAMPPVYKPNFELDESLRFEQRFHVILSDPCPGIGMYFLNPSKYPNDEYYLMANGSLAMPKVQDSSQTIVDATSYCFRLKRNSSIYTPRLCEAADPPIMDPIRTASYIGALVSVPFLLATIFVYSVIPELRNIHGTTLKCYLASLVIAYVALGVDRIPNQKNFTDVSATCLFLGFTIYSSFVASFFWLNVMCFDMWWRFGGYGPLRSNGNSGDRKKFIRYSIYAWGCPILLTTICIVMEFADVGESTIKPDFRSSGCWFATKSAEALYYYGPAGVIITTNVFLFVLTSLKILEHKRNVKRHLNSGDSRRHDENKHWFSLYVKLFVVMGICWSTEVISGIWEGPRYIWYVTDMVNALQGIVIFVIFVCKKKICRSLKQRYNSLRVTRKGCIFETRTADSSSTTTSNVDDPTSTGQVSVRMRERITVSPETPGSSSGQPDQADRKV